MNVVVSKDYLELSGKAILVHTLLRFSASAEIDNLVVVVAEEDVSSIRRLLSHVPGLKPFQVVAGSTERQYSIANGLAVVPAEADIVLVHDAARPLTSVATIDGVVQAAREAGGAVAAVPAKSTIKLVDDDGVVVKTPPRDKVWEVQTPQGFRKDILLAAYQKAKEDGFLGTDDSSLVERLAAPVKVVASDYKNIKVTTPEDLLIAEMFLKEEGDGLRGMVKQTLQKTKEKMKKHLH